MVSKLLFTISLLTATIISNAQDRITAVISQDGSINFRITLSEFYIQVSQSGRITEFGAMASGNISYDVNGRVDRIGTINVSNNLDGRIDRIGSTNISYNINGRVDRIGSTSISYSIRDRIDRIGSKSVSYNINDKVDRIGSSGISYNVHGKVDRISDSDGSIIFRSKSAFSEE